MPLKILMAHNYYQLPGGEDRAFQFDIDLLTAYGHAVYRYEIDNDEIKTLSNLKVLIKSHWNRSNYVRMCEVIKDFKPDIIHFHNTFPLISTSGYEAARIFHVPTVQTIHNYRLFCLNAMFYRNDRPCEECPRYLVPWPGVIHACYRDSYTASLGHASIHMTNRLFNSHGQKISRYIALTSFARNKLIEHGLPAEKIAIRPNAIIDPTTKREDKGFGLFVGRLSPEKGVSVLLDAVERLKGSIPIKIAGSGPMEKEVRQRASRVNSIEYLGQVDAQRVMDLMRSASYLIFPSRWYEVLPFVLIEALAVGTPVIASRIGGIPEIIKDRQTGLLFEPNDATDLAEKMDALLKQVDYRKRMSQNARNAYITTYTPETSYHNLLKIYETLV